MTSERKERASIEVKNQMMEERLDCLEKILETQNPHGGSLPKKPKFVERLDNNLIDLSAEFKQKTNDLNDAI